MFVTLINSVIHARSIPCLPTSYKNISSGNNFDGMLNDCLAKHINPTDTPKEECSETWFLISLNCSGRRITSMNNSGISSGDEMNSMPLNSLPLSMLIPLAIGDIEQSFSNSLIFRMLTFYFIAYFCPC